MGTLSKDAEERPGRSVAEVEWEWKPSSGEGSEAALKRLKRLERVRATFRQLRDKPSFDTKSKPSNR